MCAQWKSLQKGFSVLILSLEYLSTCSIYYVFSIYIFPLCISSNSRPRSISFCFKARSFRPPLPPQHLGNCICGGHSEKNAFLASSVTSFEMWFSRGWEAGQTTLGQVTSLIVFCCVPPLLPHYSVIIEPESDESLVIFNLDVFY